MSTSYEKKAPPYMERLQKEHCIKLLAMKYKDRYYLLCVTKIGITGYEDRFDSVLLAMKYKDRYGPC